MDQAIKPGQRTLAALRRMIASGELAAGARIAEIPTAARLGVSRMPVRTALRALAQEGLVVRLGARGYAARPTTVVQVEHAIAVRGVLEGLAARLVAALPARAAVVAALTTIVQEGDRVFAESDDATTMDRFYRYNLAFHTTLVEASGNEAILLALARNNHLPFASATAMLLDWTDLAWEREHLAAAHHDHLAVLAAIADGDADEAERLMRVHASISLDSLDHFRRRGLDLDHVTQRLARQSAATLAAEGRGSGIGSR